MEILPLDHSCTVLRPEIAPFREIGFPVSYYFLTPRFELEIEQCLDMIVANPSGVVSPRSGFLRRSVSTLLFVVECTQQGIRLAMISPRAFSRLHVP